MDDREEKTRFVEGLNAGSLLGALKLIPKKHDLNSAIPVIAARFSGSGTSGRTRRTFSTSSWM
jgi:hypothetical protein